MGPHALSHCLHSTKLQMSWYEDYDLLFLCLHMHDLEIFLHSIDYS